MFVQSSDWKIKMSTLTSPSFLEKFTPTETKVDELHKGSIRYLFSFQNGYSASVVRNKMSYGGRQGLWELAVLHDNKISYDNPITDDVIGYLGDDQVKKYLFDIAALPTKP